MSDKCNQTNHTNPRDEVLVALLPSKSDFAILQDQGWYRVPLRSAPRRWPPQWLAFYQPKAFDPEHFRVRYYGRVNEIDVYKRSELFPNEIPSEKSKKLYYKIDLESLEELPQPILSERPRRLIFISTTWEKFVQAQQINDLYDESPLEDRLWQEFVKLKIRAERQWELIFENRIYRLDFAIFCLEGHIDVETDGDSWHAKKERIPLDNQRDNAITSVGWHVLRYNGEQIRKRIKDECMPDVLKTVDTLGGLSDEGLVPRIFYTTLEGTAQQLALFEQKGEYKVDSGAEYNLELE
jgi:very-short-patch-repair endonuclease